MSKQFKTTKTEHFPVISSGLRVACDRESVMLLLKREDGRAGICVRMTPEASRKIAVWLVKHADAFEAGNFEVSRPS